MTRAGNINALVTAMAVLNRDELRVLAHNLAAPWADALDVDALREHVYDVANEADDASVRFVADLAGRLVLGLRLYGPLDLATDRRDWKRESYEEKLDQRMYDACAAIVERDRARQARAADSGEQPSFSTLPNIHCAQAGG